MYCKKCGFISKGTETKCMYCGTPFTEEKKIDDKMYVLKWCALTTRQLITILCFNAFVVFFITDIILIFAFDQTYNYHLTPWSFLAIFGLLFIFNEFIMPSNNKNRLLFIKATSFFISFSILFMLSYPSWIEGYKLLNYSSFFISFGYFYPSVIILIYIVGLIRFIIKRNYNVFSNFFYISFLFIWSLILFILTFIPSIEFYKDMACKLFIYICFAVSCLFAVNGLVLAILKMNTKFNNRG